MILVIDATSARRGGGVTYLQQFFSNIPEDFTGNVLVYLSTNSETLALGNHPCITYKNLGLVGRSPFTRMIWQVLVLPVVCIKADLLFVPGGVSPTRVWNVKFLTMFRNMLPFNTVEVEKHSKYYDRVRNKMLRFSIRSTIKRADAVVYISEFAKKYMENHEGLSTPSVVIPHGVSSLPMAEVQLGSSERNFGGKGYVLYVSRFESYKRHFEILEAYFSLPKELIEEYPLVLVGAYDYPEGEKCVKYIDGHLYGSSVRLLGDLSHSELPGLYASASLVLFGSVCENCPNILLEAMSCGSTILCSQVDPMPEFGGDAVSYMNPNSVGSIREGMCRLLSEPVLREEYSKRSLALSKQYSWADSIERVWSLILNLGKG